MLEYYAVSTKILEILYPQLHLTPTAVATAYRLSRVVVVGGYDETYILSVAVVLDLRNDTLAILP